MTAATSLSIVPAPSAVAPPFAMTAPALFDWIADHYRNATLTVLGTEQITVSTATARSRELAGALLAAGVGKGARVGVLGPNGPDLSVALMAITRIGAVAVPINTFFVPAELAWVLRDADIQVLLTVESLLTNDYPVRLEQAIPDLASAHDPWLTLPTLPYLRRIHVFGGSERELGVVAPRTCRRRCSRRSRNPGDSG